mgnify:FL=1
MKNLIYIVLAAMMLSNTYNIRTNTRIGVANVLQSSSDFIHPDRKNPFRKYQSFRQIK